MSATPVLDDFDMNYSEILKGRVENVSSLPTGLNASHKGYLVYYNSRVWVWDGTQWCSWDSLPWTFEDNDALDSNNPREETTAFNATSYYLGGDYFQNINLSAGYDDNVARTLGTLHFIGATNTISDWQTIRGRRFVYTAKDGSWFNIKNLSTNTVPANHKRIDTRTDTDLTEVTKAEFSYSPSSDAWILVSYERKTNTIQQSANSSSCCEQAILYELFSSTNGDKLQLGAILGSSLTRGDNCSYFQVRIEGEWSALPADNDQNIDYRTVPLFCQLWVRQNENSPWSIVKSVKYNWQSGNTISFDEEFIYMNTGSFYLACSLSEDEFGHSHAVLPVQNFERFWIRMSVARCPKINWFKRYDIPSTAIMRTNQIIGSIPYETDEGLPFNGFYEVMAFVEFREYGADGATLSSCVNSQTLELTTPGENWELIDKSGAILAGGEARWFNFSLQGSAILYIDTTECDSRIIVYQITLPNGVFSQILGGYIHAKYLGAIEGINCNS